MKTTYVIIDAYRGKTAQDSSDAPTLIQAKKELRRACKRQPWASKFVVRRGRKVLYTKHC